jgi:hypothetical protein
MTTDDKPTYAELSWCAEDVQTLREDLTIEQAEAFLERNERHLRDRLCELGWDVLGDLLQIDDEVPPEPEEEDEEEETNG